MGSEYNDSSEEVQAPVEEKDSWEESDSSDRASQLSNGPLGEIANNDSKNDSKNEVKHGTMTKTYGKATSIVEAPKDSDRN